MTDRALQRTNMVESQIRPSDVTDRRILRAMGELPREAFVPASLSALAYMDDAISLHGAAPRTTNRSMLSPRTLAKLVQLAQVEPGDRVLDVGTGRGYGAALLARLATSIIALECDEALAAAATVALKGYANVVVMTGPLYAGAQPQGPFDVIVLEGAVYDRPDSLIAQLKPGGRLVAVHYSGGVGQATLWRRDGDHIGQFAAFDAAITALPGFEHHPAFTF